MYEAIAQNKRRTLVLVLGAALLLGALGYFIGYFYWSGPVVLAIALVLAAIMSFSSYRYGDRLVLRSARAREVTP